MPAPRSLFKPTAARRLLVLLWLALLVIHGGTAAVRQVLGAAHRHDSGRQASTQATPLAVTAVTSTHFSDALAMLRSWRQAHHARNHARAPSAHFHHGGGFERHHHDIGDASVLALDDSGAADPGGAEGKSAVLTGGAELPPCLPDVPDLPTVAAHAGAWPTASAPTWQSAGARLPERPPRA